MNLLSSYSHVQLVKMFTRCRMPLRKRSRGITGHFPQWKFWAKVVESEAIKYAEGEALLRKNQQGFCRGKVCLTHILSLLRRLTSCMDKSGG